MLLTNYILSAWRNILRHKLFSIINILGLAIGLAAVMLIALYVRYETSYDSFWKNSDNIYRLHFQYTPTGQEPTEFAAVPPSIIGAMKKDFPEIRDIARIAIFNMPIINTGRTYQNSLRAIDPSFLDIFDFNVIEGDLEATINSYNGIALTKTNAERIFGTRNPMGEIFTIKTRQFTRDYMVGAIIEDLPENSRFDITSLVGYSETDWTAVGYADRWFGVPFTHSYFTMKNDTSLKDRFPSFIDRNFPQPPNSEPQIKPSEQVKLSYQNIRDLHLNFTGEREISLQTGDKNSVMMYSIVAILLLVIASINFMNLSTARSSLRAKEVSIRKVVGAVRKNLIFQFIGESVFITLLSLLIACGLTELFLPFFNNFVELNLSLNYVSIVAAVILVVAISVGIIGGIYPAFIISSFRPSEVLKSNQSTENTKSINLRFSLVLLQFSISIFLFVSTAVVYNQFRLIESFEYGYNKNNMLMIWGGDHQLVNEKFDTLAKRLTDTPEFVNVTGSSNITFGYVNPTMDAIRTNEMDRNNPVRMDYRGVTYDFFKTFEIPIIAGRTFDRAIKDERASYNEIKAGTDHVGGLILNRSALTTLNLGTPEQALGKVIYMAINGENSEDTADVEAAFSVIGIVPDIQHQSLKTPMKPAFYQLMPKSNFYINMRYVGNGADALTKLEAIWKEELPGSAFNPVFSEEALQNNYGQELRQMTMFTAFSGLAIFIACLGLFGLASFTAERRTKEIGVRKVFGAEVWQIVKLLVWQFSKPVLIANVIAWPIAYLAMSRWLESFVYRIDDMVIIALCLIAGLAALLIAWATVAGNSYAVARTNPIKALRYE